MHQTCDTLKVLANSALVQAVKNDSAGVLSTVFWEGSHTVQADMGAVISLAAAQPSIVTLSAQPDTISVSLSVPNKSGGSATVSVALVAGHTYAGDGCTQTGTTLSVSFSLPEGDSMGASVMRKCTLKQ